MSGVWLIRGGTFRASDFHLTMTSAILVFVLTGHKEQSC